MDKKPNIIFILADDMGYGDLGCYGATKIPTPNMDKLAAEGIRFIDTHSSAALCTPSRYSVMTGRYCWRSRLKSGVLWGFSEPLIEPSRMTVASLLKQNGYATAAIGKWHLGLDWHTKDGQSLCYNYDDPKGINIDGFDIDYTQPVTGGPTDNGFDYWFGTSGSLDMPPYCFIENKHTVRVPDREKEHYYTDQRKGLQASDWKDEEVDITFSKKAVEFIENHIQTNKDQPFFLYLPTVSPHRPCDIQPDFVKGKSQAGDRGDMVVLFDWVVGQVMDTLDRLGIADNTLLIVTSDNGARATCANGQDYDHKSNGDWRGQKSDIWEGGHREPFIARWPEKIKPGSVSNEIVCLSDFMATCAAITGQSLPEKGGEDSYNILPVLLGQTADKPVRETIVHHSGGGMFSIRRDKWKMIQGLGSGGHSKPRTIEPEPDGPQGQLYDLKKDPAETTNLWLEHPEIVKQLTELLEKYKKNGRS